VRGGKAPVYQYFHVVTQDDHGMTGEAVVNRSDYATVDDLADACHDAEKQETLDIHRYFEKLAAKEGRSK
jgi:hypothetical protein